jgi:hypothetical protein
MSAAALQRRTSLTPVAVAAAAPRRGSSSASAAAASTPSQRRRVAAAAAKDDAAKAAPAAKGQQRAVQYGADWYAATREASKPSTVREEIARRRAVNDVAYRDRRLNSDAWEGSEYKGSPVNILSLLVALFLLVPVLGLGFAYKTYGVLWG